MVITFEKKYLKDLYVNGKANDKKHRFQPAVIKKYQFCIDILKGVSGVEALYPIKSLRYEVLQGDKAGISSISVNMQYRIEFTVNETGNEPIITVCNIIELSNHYK
jgi:proteic killer suppression protein